jgi:hypothetical protein
VAYVVVDYHLMDDRKPYIYKVTEYGEQWTEITGDLPADHPLDYALSLAENPNRQKMLFAGTGRGFYYTMDEGQHWTRLQDALPTAPVSWIMVEPRYHDVVISTYGRGLFVLRDIVRLEQADQVDANAEIHLYEPRPGFRKARSGEATFLYKLASDSTPVTFEILDSAGTNIRTFEALGVEGLNTAEWDLLYDGPAQVELRTIPPYNPHIWEEARFLDQETRPINHWGIRGPQSRGPIAFPGDYSVRMTVDGQSQTRPFTVLKDPAITTSVAEMAASTRTQIRIRDGMNRTVDMINRLEIMRKQVEDLRAENNGAALAALEELDRKMLDAELHFLSVTDLHSDDKWYVEAYKVYMQYIWLSGEVALGAGDVQGGAEYRPTDAAMEWLETLEGELAAGAVEFDRVVGTDVPAFNREWEGRLPAIVVPPAGS